MAKVNLSSPIYHDEAAARAHLEALLADNGVLFVASGNTVSAYDPETLLKQWETLNSSISTLAKSGEQLFAGGGHGLFIIYQLSFSNFH